MSPKLWLPLVALFCLQAPTLAAHSGLAPIDPSESDDEHFVVDTGSGLDTGCTYRDGGSLIFKVKIDRYVGNVKSDGTLENPDLLKKQGVVSSNAQLAMPAFDIDFAQGEIDEVYFNGHLLGTLQGSDGTWYRNGFTVPIEWVKFPAARGENGKPAAAENEIRVDIDKNAEGWCAAIDWGEVSFKAMAPLLLIHGTGANPQDAWEELPGVTEYLKSQGIPFEHRIQLTPNGRIASNSKELQSVVQAQAKSFGVQKVHLVSHSKGGLDSRSYLSNNYNSEKEVRVLSLNTLSTPHRGTILADISVAQRNPDGGNAVSLDNQIDAFIVADHYIQLSGRVGADRPAIDDLRVADVAKFNSENPFPSSVKLYTYSANADLDGDRVIGADETRPFVPQSIPDPIAGTAGNLAYQILGNVATVRVTQENQFFGLVRYQLVEPNVTNPDTDFQINDLLVTDVSAQHPSQSQHFPPFARNHRNMKDQQTMDRILERIRQNFPVN